MVLTNSNNPGDFFGVRTTVVTYLATDGSGNSASCDFSVTVNDTENPSISCPNIVQSNDLGNCSALVTFAPAISDNCPSPNLAQLAGLASGSIFSLGVHNASLSLTDAAGNQVSCSFTITINDDEAPQLTCPNSFGLNSTAVACEEVATYTPPNIITDVTDNCPGVSLTQVSGLGSGVMYPVGVTTNVFMATDAAGNTSICSFTVTIADVTLPAITCPPDISVTVGTLFTNTGIMQRGIMLCGAIVDIPGPVFTDNCPLTTFNISNDFNNQGAEVNAFFPVGTTTIVYTATDQSGNTATDEITITVVDNQPPMATPPATINVVVPVMGQTAMIVTYNPPIGIDNCPNVSTTLLSGVGSGGIFPVGSTTEIYLVTDASGNTATVSFVVNVFDFGTPLSVELISFTAEKTSDLKDVILNWETINELNASHFEIELAKGRNNLGDFMFEPIGVRLANGGIRFTQNYSFLDDELNKSGERYYRLKMFDNNGNFEYSEIRQLTFLNEDFEIQNVYPNPFEEQFTIELNALYEQNLTIRLMDAHGKLILNKVIPVGSGLSMIQLEVDAKLASGVYVIELQSKRKQFTQRVIKF